MKDSHKSHRHKHRVEEREVDDERKGHHRRERRSRSRERHQGGHEDRGQEDRRHHHGRVKDEAPPEEEPHRPRHRRDEMQKHSQKSKWENDENDSIHNGGRRNGDSKMVWGKKGEEEGKPKKAAENKAKPDFGLSGKLAEEVNTYKGVVIKYSEPPEGRMPKRRWRLYPFKGDSALPTMYIHRQSAYLIGRDRIVADLPIDHPSCSKQHAVLQYRVVSYTRPDGVKGNRVRPYIIDLDSANGTYVNNERIEARRYVELMEKDVVKFAYSSREYVLLHEHSRDDEEDDNVPFDQVTVKTEPHP